MGLVKVGQSCWITAALKNQIIPFDDGINKQSKSLPSTQNPKHEFGEPNHIFSSFVDAIDFVTDNISGWSILKDRTNTVIKYPKNRNANGMDRENGIITICIGHASDITFETLLALST